MSAMDPSQNIPDGFVPLKGDASSRRYYRGPDGILVVYPEAMAGSFRDFLFWHQRYRSVDLPVPAVIAVYPDRLQMLLEDWGDRDGVHYLNSCTSTRARQEFVQTIMELGGRVPGMSDGVAEFRLPPVPVERELAFMLEHAGDTLLSGQKPLWLRTLCSDTCDRLRNLPTELAHRDFHLRNILVREHGCCIIDFQDTRLAPEGYDTASLLFDNYADLSDVAHGLFSGLDDPAFRWVALQRSLKALGTFCYFGLKMEKPWFLSSIRPAMAHILDHLHILDLKAVVEKWKGLIQATDRFIPADG